METICPHCKAQQDVPEVYSDREIKCMSCKTPFVVEATPLISKSKHLLFFISVIILLLIASLLSTHFARKDGRKTGYNKGYSKGYGSGFFAGIDNERQFGQQKPKDDPYVTNDVDLVYAYPFQKSIPTSTGAVSSSDWKITEGEKGSDYCTISWKFRFDSLVSGEVCPRFLFYDIDGFLLLESYHTTQFLDVVEGQIYNFTNTVFLEKELVSKISSCGAVVQKF